MESLMGLILDTNSEILGVEILRESIGLLDLKRTDAHESKSDHIYCYGDGAIEVSKEWLKELLEFFSKPENEKYLYEDKIPVDISKAHIIRSSWEG